MKKVVITLLMLAVLSQLNAICHNTLSGKVTDIHTAEPLDGAVVSVTDQRGVLVCSATADKEGKYLINTICDGEYKVIVQHFDCTYRVFKLSVKGDVRRNFSLEHHEEELHELVVAAKRLNKTTSSTEIVLNKREITAFSETNIGTALGCIAGVSTFSTGSAIVKPVIHGLHSSRVPVLNNGIKQEDQQWGVEHAPNIDLNAANSLRVIKGAGALEYAGDAIGGLVLVEPKTLTVGSMLQGSVLTSLITNGRGANVAADIEKGFDGGLSFYFQGSYKRLGDLSAPKYMLSNTGTEERNFSFQSQYEKDAFGIKAFYSLYSAEIGILKAAHIGSLENLLDAINSREPKFVEKFKTSIGLPKQAIRHHFLKINTTYAFVFGKLDFSYAFQFNNRKEYDLRKSEKYQGKPSMNLDLITQDCKIDFSPVLRDGRRAKFGLLAVLQKNRPVFGTGLKPLIPFYYQYDFGAYWIESYKINDDWTLEGGLRADFRSLDAEKVYSKARWRSLGYDKRYPELVIGDLGLSYITNPRLSFWGYAATLGGSYQLGKTSSLSMNYSLSSRAPNPAELFSDGLHHSAAAIELGDLELKKEKSNKLIATLKGQADFRFNFELTGHYNYVKNFISNIPDGAERTIRGAFPVWRYIQTDASIVGFDLNLDYSISPKWNVAGNFAYLYGQDMRNKTPLINMPPLNLTNSIEYKNEAWKSFFLKLSHQFVFRQNRFPNYNFILNDIIEDGNLVSKELDISTPPPAASLLNLSAGLAFNVLDKNKLSTTLSVQNILNSSSRNYLNRLRYYADEQGRSFVLKIHYSF